MACKADKTIPAFDAGFIRRSDFGSKSDFIFGAATAAFQVEGACGRHGRQKSIWDTHAEQENLYAPYDEDAVCHYDRYKEDVNLMKDIGFDAYRFSISWSRILTYEFKEVDEDCRFAENKKRIEKTVTVNEQGVQFYQKLLDKLEDSDIQPFVTLLHFDHPQVLEDRLGGFLNEKMTDLFEEFVDICFDKFGDRVKHWITINEPWSFVHGAYVQNFLAPAKGRVKDSMWKEETEVDRLLELLGMNPDDHEDGKSRFGKHGIGLAKQLEHLSKLASSTGATSAESTTPEASSTGATSTESTTPAARSASVTSTETTDLAKNLAADAYTVAHNLLLAHAKAVQLYRTKYQRRQRGEIGITLVGAWFLPLTNSKEDKEARQRALDFMFGWFLDPIVNGEYPKTMVDNVTKYPVGSAPKGHLPVERMEKDKKLIHGSYDFIGLNYYTTYYVSHKETSGGNYIADHRIEYHKRDPNYVYIGAEKGASGWLYGYAKGIQELLAYMKDRYEKNTKNKSLPIYITENGIDDHDDHSGTCWNAFWDKKRVSYLHDHLAYVLAAKLHDKVNVKGYFTWSLLDNFEWNEGFKVRFGIIYVDYDDGGKRYPKLSAKWLKHFLAN